MQRLAHALATTGLALCACEAAPAPTGTIVGLVVSPGDAIVQPGGVFRFSAQVQGAGNVPQEVAWSVETEDDTSDWAGTVERNGTFRARSSPPPQTIRARVVAASRSRPDVTGAAHVQIPQASLVITPETASVFLGDSIQFQAAIGGTVDTDLTWWVDRGTIDSTGLYHAPAVGTPGDVASVVVRSYALGRQASAMVALKLRPPVVTALSGPAGPGDQLTIFATGLLQVVGWPEIAVFFPTAGRDPIEVHGLVYLPYLDRFNVTVPIGATSGPLRIAIPGLSGTVRVYSEPIAFERAPRLRLHPERLDLAAGESTAVRVAFLGTDRAFPLTFEADRGSFDGDRYVAPPAVDSISFATIRACVAGTSICSGTVVGLHPFRIEPAVAVVPAGTSMDFSIVGATDVTFSLRGPGVLTPEGRFTAPSALADSGPEWIFATDGTHQERAQVAPGGLVNGLVARVQDYIDHRVPDGTPGLPFGAIAENLAIHGSRAYVAMRPAAVSFTQSLFSLTLYWMDVFDLSDPLHPAWVGAVESSTRPMSLRVSHGRLYAFSNDDSSANSGRTIAVYDLSGPLPRLARRMVWPLEVGRVFRLVEPPALDDDFLYVFGTARDEGQPVDIYRLDDGPLETPRTVNIPFPPLNSSISGFTARAGRAYATFMQQAPETVFSRLAAWDLSTDPARLLGVVDAPVGIALAGAPTFAGRYLLAGGCLYDTAPPLPARVSCPPTGRIVVAGDGDRFVVNDGQVLDFSDPAAVRISGRFPMGSGNGALSGGYLFLAEGIGGMGVYDTRANSGPKPRGDLGFTQPYVFPEALVGAIGDGGLFYGAGLALDELNLLGWAFVGTWDLQSSPPAFVWQEAMGSEACAPFCAPSAIALAGGALLVGRTDALDVRSLAVPRAPPMVSQVPVAVSAIATRGNLAWVGTQGAHLIAIDVSNPASPVVLGDLTLHGIATGIAALGVDRLAVAETTPDGSGGDLEIVDVSAASAPVSLGTANLQLPCAGVAVDGQVAAVATASGLATVDLTNPARPALLAIDPVVADAFGDAYRPLRAVAVAIHDGLAWVNSAGYLVGPFGEGFSVLFGYDLRDPRHPRQVMRMDGGFMNGLVFDGNRAMLLGPAPGELGVEQPYNLILSLEPPGELQR